MKRSQANTLVTCQRALVTVSLCVLALFAGKSSAQTEPGEITLPWVLEKTLLNNVQLQAFPYELRVSEALTLQAGVKPNPEFSVEVENLLGTGDMQGVDNVEVTLGLSQLIELGDKRQRRIDVAQASERQKLGEYELLRLDILAQATGRYYQLLRLQALQDWSERRILVEREALKAIESRARAGAVIEADVTKMALRLSHSKAVKERLDGETALARLRLAAIWSGEPHFQRAAGELKPLTRLPAAASVLNAIERAPQYLQLLSTGRLMYAKRRMEEAKAQHDVTLGLGVRSYDGFDDGALMFNFSMPIPLSNPNQGNILAAKANEAMAMEQQKLARSQLRLSLLEIHQAMVNNVGQARLIEQQILPLARRLLKDTQAAYQTGQTNVLQLADAQSELFSVERDLIEAEAAVYRQKLELERITGQSMSTNPFNAMPAAAQENR
ncbi:TolC family protein [uncultured Shewanella sp.]|uniref:TolC family protein n=1 Tax=uncultured Shewanella sp. TaxID=173975 RepID=UPI0026283442|nr:TolC family protein [uncultured Shewanella sp.]